MTKLLVISNLLLCFNMILCIPVNCQQVLTLQETQQLALQNSPSLQLASLETMYYEQNKKTSTEIPKTTINWMHGQYNSIVSDDNNFTISQTLPFPTTLGRQSNLNQALLTKSEMNKKRIANEVLLEVSMAYLRLSHTKLMGQLLERQDSLYANLLHAASIRFKTGEGTMLEKISAETQHNEIIHAMRANNADKKIYQSKLAFHVGMSDIEPVVNIEPTRLTSESIEQNPNLQFQEQQIEVTHYQKKVEQARVLPDLSVGFFSQTLIGYQTVNGQEQYFGSNDRFNGFEIGLAIPLWLGPHVAKIKAAEAEKKIATQQFENLRKNLTAHYDQAKQEYEKAAQSLAYYNDYALPNARQLIRQNDLSFKNGEIDYTTYLLNLKQGLMIEEGYYKTLLEFQLQHLQVGYLTGNLWIDNESN